MHATKLLVIAAILFLGPASAQDDTPVSRLEAFEHFAQKSTARVLWSKEIERIKTD